MPARRWIAVVVGFFSVSSVKLEYHALPACPAIALVVTAVFDQASDPGAAGQRTGWAALGLCLLARAVLREVGPHHSLKPLVDRLNAVHRPGDVLIHERGLEKWGGLLFYTRRPVLILDGRRGDPEFGAGLPEAAGRGPFTM